MLSVDTNNFLNADTCLTYVSLGLASMSKEKLRNEALILLQ